ncbi:MAG: hypothetical protein Q4P18_06990 [Methanobrevibacter sp.]|uniref:hypothetical protein n=1 Tax=Methanobrevibacter sp. TaxID=66852 RepID=UPI0026DEFF7D|nr:hypothetical protein [Methanobrevibacter sp.]MDO5849262.1 hypothetical protein [Methanobrevibacter sp.]
MNEYLRDDALRHQNFKFNMTSLILYQGQVIGYFTLLADLIEIKKLNMYDYNKIIFKSPFKTLPAVKLARFAIDKKFTNIGLGTEILSRILLSIYDKSNYIGIRYVTVDGFAKAFNFYTKNGLIPFKKEEQKLNKINKIIKKDPEKTISLYFDLYNYKKFLMLLMPYYI